GVSVGPPTRIRRSRAYLVDDLVLDPVLAPQRARPAVLPGSLGTLSVRWNSADEHRSDLDSADRAAPHLQHARVHPDDGGDALPQPPARRGGRGREMHLRTSLEPGAARGMSARRA